MRRKLSSNIAQYTSPQPTSPQFLADLDRAAALHMWGVRIDIVPGYTQNGSNLTDPLDKIDAIKARGLKVLAMMPHWLRDKTQVLDAATLSSFAAKVATQLGSMIDIVELGNEPGSPDFTGGQAPLPGFQSIVSAIFIDALRSHGYTGKIITPGLAPVDGGLYIKIDDFLNTYWTDLDPIYQAEIYGTGVHLYSPPYPSDRSYYKSWGQLDAAFAITGKPFYVTELNVQGITGTAQAAQLTDSFNALAARPDVNRAFIFEMSDQSSADASLSYGVYTQTGHPRAILGSIEAWQGLPITLADSGLP